MSSSFTRTPQGFPYTNMYPCSCTLIRLKFCYSCSALGNRHFKMAEWRMQRETGTFKSCIFAKGKIIQVRHQSYPRQSHGGVWKAHPSLGPYSSLVAQARLLCIILNMSLSHIPLNQSTTWSFFTKILCTHSFC